MAGKLYTFRLAIRNMTWNLKMAGFSIYIKGTEASEQVEEPLNWTSRPLDYYVELSEPPLRSLSQCAYDTWQRHSCQVENLDFLQFYQVGCHLK